MNAIAPSVAGGKWKRNRSIRVYGTRPKVDATVSQHFGTPRQRVTRKVVTFARLRPLHTFSDQLASLHLAIRGGDSV